MVNYQISAHKPVFFSGREDGSDFRRLISDSKSGKVELGAHQGWDTNWESLRYAL